MLYLASIENVDQYLLGKKFDVIIIDGDLDRYKCTVKSIELLNDNGAIVLDNSEGYWGDEGTYPILNLFRENKFCRTRIFRSKQPSYLNITTIRNPAH